MIAKNDKIIAHHLRELIVKLYKRIHREISNKEQMSVADQNVMYQLTQKGKLLPSELCTMLNMSSQYISQVVNHLVELEFISRNPSPTDKRKSFIKLTEKGKQRVLQSRKEREEWLANLIANQYSAEDKATIQKAVALLAVLTGRE